jgi:hypothetical protein
MASGANPGDLLYRAYQGHTSAPSTLAMIGWQDGDGDGIFDVLDVPQSLVGSGYYDASQGVYRFIGKAAVGTLMNRNPSGLQNDITINQIDRAEYRFDGGPWQTAVVYGTYEADLKLVLPVPAGAQSIEIRTRDDVTGVVSPTFQGSLLRPTSTLAPGINGFVWNDLDKNGNWDIGEPGLAAATVRLVDDRGQTLQLRRGIEPDDYPTDGTRLNQVLADVVLKAVGSDVTNDGVKALQSTFASTGARVFATASGPGSVSGDWTQSTRNLHMEFKSPVTTISIDAVGSANGSYGRLEIYGQDGKLLGRYTTKSLANGGKETMTLSRPTADIVYAVVRGHAGTTVVLDNLRFGPEAVTVTDIMGRYSLPSLPPGNYLVRVGVGGGQIATNPASAAQSASLLAGQSLGAVDFGVWSLTSRWQNPANRLDVNADGAVSPLDVLRVINYLNSSETGVLTAADPTPPYLDVSGDGMVTPLDALFIINALNQGVEGEAFVGGSGGAVGRPGGAEGEVLVGILPTFSSARSSSGGEITLPIPSVAMVDREPPSEVTSGLVTPAASNRMRPALDGEPPLGVQHPVRGTSEDIGSGVRQDGRQASGCRKNRLLEEEIDIDPFGSLGVDQST